MFHYSHHTAQHIFPECIYVLDTFQMLVLNILVFSGSLSVLEIFNLFYCPVGKKHDCSSCLQSNCNL